MIVDAHQHFWNPARGDYGWLTPDLPVCRIYGPDDLEPLMRAAGVEATVLVQAAPTVAETDYILDIARCTPWVLGVVGWIDLGAPDAVEQMWTRARDPLFVGVRPMLQDIAERDWILRPELNAVLAQVAAQELVFDALVLSDQVGVIDELAARHPNLAIVLDHGAKPRLGDVAAMAAWEADIRRLAERPNVSCKLSGLLTELPAGADVAHLKRAAVMVLDAFGAERVLWGSDWPVLTLAGDYGGWRALAQEIVAAHAPHALDAVMGGNALRLYGRKRTAKR